MQYCQLAIYRVAESSSSHHPATYPCFLQTSLITLPTCLGLSKCPYTAPSAKFVVLVLATSDFSNLSSCLHFQSSRPASRLDANYSTRSAFLHSDFRHLRMSNVCASLISLLSLSSSWALTLSASKISARFFRCASSAASQIGLSLLLYSLIFPAKSRYSAVRRSRASRLRF